jgi:hypothetical protein
VQVAVNRHQFLESTRQIAAARSPDDSALGWRQIAPQRFRIRFARSRHRLSKLSKLSFRNFSPKFKKANGINALVKIVKIVTIFPAWAVACSVRA